MNAAPPPPFAGDLVLAGGGHTHALLLRMIGMTGGLRGVRVTLISDSALAPYSGMLPGHIEGRYTREEMHIDLRRLCRFAGAVFIQSACTGLDLAEKRVLLAAQPPVSWDVLSLNTGCVPKLDSVPGAKEHTVPARPVPQLLDAWSRICQAAEEGAAEPDLVIIGGGAGGAELALAMHTRLRGRCRITLVHRGADVLDAHHPRVQRLCRAALERCGVRVLTGTAAAEVRAGAVILENGETLRASHAFFVAGVSGPDWLRHSGLELDEDGFVRVNAALQSLSHPDIFAAGDIASLTGTPRPKSGVFAVRAAKPLMENLQRHLEGRPLRDWKPQRHFLSLIGTGDGRAIASRGGFALHSAALWRLKEWIDRGFMRKFADLPAMSDADATANASGSRGDASALAARSVLPDSAKALELQARMRCAGCAAKTPGGVLQRVMQRLREEFPDNFSAGEAASEIEVSLSQPDDAAIFAVPAGRHLVQTADFMPAVVDDPHLFGRIAALHCFSDIFAMGAEPHSALCLAQTPFGGETVTERLLHRLLSGVLHEMRGLGAKLIGGHAAEGAVTGLALACNGLIAPRAAMTKGGLGPGQALVLTKALGTGAILAAEMRLRAKAEWLETAIASMLIPNLAAARIFAAHGSTGCTDVTGFGLAGHLIEMLTASGARAEIVRNALPALPGAAEVLGEGIRSSLHEANRRSAEISGAAAAGGEDVLTQLLFDPQTSGGLLAGVPGENLEGCLRSLRQAGLPAAAVIGFVREPAGGAARIVLH